MPLKIITPEKPTEEVVGKSVFVVGPIIGAPADWFAILKSHFEVYANKYNVDITVITNRNESDHEEIESALQKRHIENFPWILEKLAHALQNGYVLICLPKPIEKVQSYAEFARYVLPIALHANLHEGAKVVISHEKDFQFSPYLQAHLESADAALKTHSIESAVETICRNAVSAHLQIQVNRTERYDSMLD